MAEFVIQLNRGGEWRKVTTIRYEADHAGRENRRRAIREGFLKLSDWRASDQFTGLALRLAEPLPRGRFLVITRVGQ